jgi:hypothetical protein
MKKWYLVLPLAVLLASACEDNPPGEGEGEGEGERVEAPAPQSRFPRLSHPQWEKAVRDLLLLPADTSFSDTLRADPNPGGAIFENHGALRVDQALWQGYQRAAEEVAAFVALDTARLEALAPVVAGETAEQRAETFVRTHARRAHRRPVDDGDVATYLALHATGASAYPEMGDAFAAGARVVIEAWLQSPFFLYRPELSTRADDADVALDDHEVASKLSFALWGTMPDDALQGAADRGELATADQVAAAAERLLADGRALAAVEDFHGRLFELERIRRVQGLGESLAEEHRLYTGEVYASGGGLAELLTSSRTFVNAELAPIYGLDPAGFDDQMTPVDLDPAERRGVLTMAGFLAENAAGGAPDPIHRGVWISTHLACNTVPAPPDDIPPFPSAQGQTNREVVEELTEAEGTVCASCHTTLINPYGFPFEGYDEQGRLRAEDNGFPIDTSSLFFLGEESHEVAGALEMVDALAASPAVHACYAEHWLQFLYGRDLVDAVDAPLVENVGALSLDERASLEDLIVRFVRSDAFRYRSGEELP